MTNEKLVSEFKRWVELGKLAVWIKMPHSRTWILSSPTIDWSHNYTYIVADEQAELRKLQINEPDTKFQVKPKNGKTWIDVELEEDLWQPFLQYRVKPKEWYEDKNMIGKPVWVRDKDYKDWRLDIFKEYNKKAEHPFKCEFYCWVQAKPVEPEDTFGYKRNTNDK